MKKYRGYIINCGFDLKNLNQTEKRQYIGRIKDSSGNIVEIPNSHGFNFIPAESKEMCLRRCMNFINRFLN